MVVPKPYSDHHDVVNLEQQLDDQRKCIARLHGQLEELAEMNTFWQRRYWREINRQRCRDRSLIRAAWRLFRLRIRRWF